LKKKLIFSKVNIKYLKIKIIVKLKHTIKVSTNLDLTLSSRYLSTSKPKSQLKTMDKTIIRTKTGSPHA